MNQQFGKQASDQAEKLFKDALTVGNVQAFTEKGVVATQEFYAKTVTAAQDNAKALTEVAETAWGSTKMLNDKIVQNLTSNVEVAFATAQAMATAKSLSEIAKLQMDFIQKLATQATEQTKEFADLSARAVQHVFEKTQIIATKSFKSTSSEQFSRVSSQPETARGSSRSSLLLSRTTALRYGSKVERFCHRRFSVRVCYRRIAD